MPVLSVQITEVEPKTSAAINLLTNPFFFKILSMPKAKITVIATGKPSGIAATATATAVTNISKMSRPLIAPPTKIAIEIIPTIKAIILLKRAIFF